MRRNGYGRDGEASARQHAEALACFEHAIELETDNLQAWVGKGVCLGTWARWRSSGVLRPRDGTGAECELRWLNKAQALINLKRYEEAIEAANCALVLNPRDEKAWFREEPRCFV